MSKGDKNNQPITLPKGEAFSSGAVKKKVFSEAVQHPTTLIMAAVSILGGLYMGLVNFNETSFAVTVGAAVCSIMSWVYHFVIRGDKVAKEYIQELLEKRRQFKAQQGLNIESRCRTGGFTEGEKAAKELREAYLRLDDYLREQHRESESPTAKRFMILAEESYLQGVHFVTKAFSIYSVLQEMNGTKLKEEMDVWEKTLESLKNDRSREKKQREYLMAALQEKITNHSERVRLFEQRYETLTQLLDQCESLEATLDAAYLEAVDLISTQSPTFQGDAAKRLERAVAAARKVEDRLRGMENGPDFDKEDDIYLKAARENRE